MRIPIPYLIAALDRSAPGGPRSRQRVDRRLSSREMHLAPRPLSSTPDPATVRAMATVRNVMGHRLGRVKNFVIDVNACRVTHAVVALEPTDRSVSTELSVPWEALVPSRDGRAFVLRLDEMLVGSP